MTSQPQFLLDKRTGRAYTCTLAEIQAMAHVCAQQNIQLLCNEQCTISGITHESLVLALLSASMDLNSFPGKGKGAYIMRPKIKLTQELVRKTVRARDKVGLSHIDQIVSEWQTSMIELQHHSSIFGDIAVQFPKDDLNLIGAIFDKVSVRPRDIVLARYQKYYIYIYISL